jgi:hypothetical protein
MFITCGDLRIVQSNKKPKWSELLSLISYKRLQVVIEGALVLPTDLPQVPKWEGTFVVENTPTSKYI